MDKRVERRSSRLGSPERVKYLVKWANWPETYNSWESDRHLEHSAHLVEGYERNLLAQGDVHEGRWRTIGGLASPQVGRGTQVRWWGP